MPSPSQSTSASLLRVCHLALITFLIRYRRTVLGPLWLLVAPSLFIILLGLLFAEIGSRPLDVFVPHLAIGVIVWTLISSFFVQSATIYQRNRARILQGSMALNEIVSVDVFSHLITFVHQILIILAIFIYFRIPLSLYAITSVVGLVLLIANGISTVHVFGILGVRYRDLSEVVQAIMRIAFLATPIIWMPGDTGRGVVMGALLIFNPFYHFLEIVRAPLLNNPIEPLSWIVVIAITLFGFLLAWAMDRRYARFVPLWV